MHLRVFDQKEGVIRKNPVVRSVFLLFPVILGSGIKELGDFSLIASLALALIVCVRSVLTVVQGRFQFFDGRHRTLYSFGIEPFKVIL